MFADTRETETVFGPVIQAGLEALKVNVLVRLLKSENKTQKLKVPLIFWIERGCMRFLSCVHLVCSKIRFSMNCMHMHFSEI